MVIPANFAACYGITAEEVHIAADQATRNRRLDNTATSVKKQSIKEQQQKGKYSPGHTRCGDKLHTCSCGERYKESRAGFPLFKWLNLDPQNISCLDLDAGQPKVVQRGSPWYEKNV